MHISLKKKVIDSDVTLTLLYGCETWPITKKLMHNIQVFHGATERSMLDIKIQDRVCNSDIRRKTKNYRHHKHGLLYVVAIDWKYGYVRWQQMDQEDALLVSMDKSLAARVAATALNGWYHRGGGSTMDPTGCGEELVVQDGRGLSPELDVR